MAQYRFSEAPTPIRNFLVYSQTIRGRSEKTVNEYFLDLRIFFRFIIQFKKICAPSIPFNEIDISIVDESLIRSISISDIYEFFIFLDSDRNNKSRSRARKASTLRSFYKYLTVKAGILDKNPVADLDLPKPPKKLPVHLEFDECVRLLSAVDGKNRQRDYAILVVFLNTGIRLSELVGINLPDIQDNKLRVLGKGNKERIVYLNDACRDAIRAYIQVRPVDGVIDKKALFLSNRRTRISHQMVQNLVKKYIEKAGLDPQRYSTHKLRHTAATLMFQNGVDVRVLKEVLGHENLGTTQIYTHLGTTQLEEAAKANPLGRIRKGTVNE